MTDLTDPDFLRAIKSRACMGFGLSSNMTLAKGSIQTIANIEWVVSVIFNPPCCEEAETVYLVARSNYKPSGQGWSGVPCSVCGTTYTVKDDRT